MDTQCCILLCCIHKKIERMREKKLKCRLHYVISKTGSRCPMVRGIPTRVIFSNILLYQDIIWLFFLGSLYMFFIYLESHMYIQYNICIIQIYTVDIKIKPVNINEGRINRQKVGGWANKTNTQISSQNRANRGQKSINRTVLECYRETLTPNQSRKDGLTGRQNKEKPLDRPIHDNRQKKQQA